MMVAGDNLWGKQTAQTHAAHKRTQQNPQRNGRRADHKLENLEPDNFVDQSGATTADKKKDKKRQIPLLLRNRYRLICNHLTHNLMHTPAETLFECELRIVPQGGKGEPAAELEECSMFNS